jgi:putative protein-disulfide isomerase
MFDNLFAFIAFCSLTLTACSAPGQNKNMEENPLNCSIDKGICEIALNNEYSAAPLIADTAKKFKIIYFTDPICSSCWGIEPELRKLKLEYGHAVEIEYRMGGLLPSWENFNGGGISKPSDVAHHWEEMSSYYGMPIDGNVWLEDPLHSSYPPSIAYKAAELQNKQKAIDFLRRIREMVFLEKKNIAKWEHLRAAAFTVGLDTTQLKKDCEGKAVQLFQDDLNLSRAMGVRGFPTLFFTDSDNSRIALVGYKPYASYEQAIFKLSGEAEGKKGIVNVNNAFKFYSSLTTKEFSILTETPKDGADKYLEDLLKKGVITKQLSKNGVLWKAK